MLKVVPQLSSLEFASPTRKAPNSQQIPALSTQPGEAETFPMASPKRDSFPHLGRPRGRLGREGLVLCHSSIRDVHLPPRQHTSAQQKSPPNISPRAARGNPEPWEGPQRPQPLTHPCPCCSRPLNGPKRAKPLGFVPPSWGCRGSQTSLSPCWCSLPSRRSGGRVLSFFFLAFSP